MAVLTAMPVVLINWNSAVAVRFVLFVEVELRISVLGFLGFLPDVCLEVDKYTVVCKKV